MRKVSVALPGLTLGSARASHGCCQRSDFMLTGQILVRQPDGGRAVTDGRGDSLDRVAASITGGEYARHRSLQRERCAIERPQGWWRPRTCNVATGENEPVPELNSAGEPLSARLTADHHEQRVGRNLLDPVERFAVQSQRGEMLVAFAVDHLSLQPDHEVGRGLNLLDQVVRHRAAEASPADHHGYLAGILGQVHCGLTGRVARANDEDVTADHCLRLAVDRTVEDARADQGFQPRNAKAPPGDARREDYCPGRRVRATGDMHQVIVVPALDSGGGLRENHVRAEHPGLLTRSASELMTADTVREARIVPDHGAAPGLTARHGFLEDDRLQPLRCRIDRGSEPGWSRADDNDVAHVDIARRAPTHGRNNVGSRGLHDRLLVMADHHWQVRVIETLASELLTALLAVCRVEMEWHVEPREQLPELVGAGILKPSDDVEQLEVRALV